MYTVHNTPLFTHARDAASRCIVRFIFITATGAPRCALCCFDRNNRRGNPPVYNRSLGCYVYSSDRRCLALSVTPCGAVGGMGSLGAPCCSPWPGVPWNCRGHKCGCTSKPLGRRSHPGSMRCTRACSCLRCRWDRSAFVGGQ